MQLPHPLENMVGLSRIGCARVSEYLPGPSIQVVDEAVLFQPRRDSAIYAVVQKAKLVSGKLGELCHHKWMYSVCSFDLDFYI